jgi:hypothetical protein
MFCARWSNNNTDEKKRPEQKSHILRARHVWWLVASKDNPNSSRRAMHALHKQGLQGRCASVGCNLTLHNLRRPGAHKGRTGLACVCAKCHKGTLAASTADRPDTLYRRWRETEQLTVLCFVHIHSVRRRAKTRRWKGRISSFAMSYRDRPTWPLHPARSTEGCARGGGEESKQDTLQKNAYMWRRSSVGQEMMTYL